MAIYISQKILPLNFLLVEHHHYKPKNCHPSANHQRFPVKLQKIKNKIRCHARLFFLHYLSDFHPTLAHLFRSRHAFHLHFFTWRHFNEMGKHESCEFSKCVQYMQRSVHYYYFLIGNIIHTRWTIKEHFFRHIANNINNRHIIQHRLYLL